MARRGQNVGDEEEAAGRLTARFTELSQAAFAVEADIKALVDCEHAVHFSRQSNVVRERLQVLQLEAQVRGQ